MRSATAIRIWSRRCRRRRKSSGTCPTCSEPGRRDAGRPALRAELRGLRVLLQFRRRGDGMRDQDGAPVSRRQGAARALSHHHLRGRVPWPHAGDARGRRPGEISRRLRSAGRRLRSGSARRSRGGEEGDRSGNRRHPDRADAGRGRRARGAASVLPGVARSCATSTACCWCSTRCRPAWAAPANCSPTSASA